MSRTLRFHSKLYQRRAIQAAIEAYEDFADFNLEKQDPYYVVEVSPKEQEDAAYLPDEFANYVLGEAHELR